MTIVASRGVMHTFYIQDHREGGQEHEAVELADLCLAEWRAFLASHGLDRDLDDFSAPGPARATRRLLTVDSASSVQHAAAGAPRGRAWTEVGPAHLGEFAGVSNWSSSALGDRNRSSQCLGFCPGRVAGDGARVEVLAGCWWRRVARQRGWNSED